MPDLTQTRRDLHAELESAAAAVHFGESKSPGKSAAPPRESATQSKPSPEPATEPEAAAKPMPALATDPGEIPEPLPLWRDRQAWISAFTSFSVHLTALVILAFIAMALQNDVIEAVSARLGDEDLAALDVSLDPAELPRFELEAMPSPNLDAVQMERVTPADLEREFASDQFAPPSVAEDDGDGSGLMFQKPGGGRAVTKGSFAVWTEPKDPAPREDYLIVIEIAVPDKIKRFPGSDLKIEVRGTDTYYLSIPGTRTPPWLRGDLPIVDGKVQVPIRVPGAVANVRDIINVRSVKILKEHQRMEIKF